MGHKNYGFTIVEILVASAVALMAFAVLYYVSFTIRDNINITSGILGITEEGRFALNRMSRDIREAKSIRSSYGAYITDNDMIILDVPSIDALGDIIDPENNLDIIIYTLDSNTKTLVRIVDATSGSRTDSTEVIADKIENLLFSSQGVGLSSVGDKGAIKTVTVKIVTSATSPRFYRENEIISSISLRNKNR